MDAGVDDDTMRGGPGDDSLDTGAPVYPDYDNDAAFGEEGSDYLFGNVPGLPSGVTRLYGGDGDDYLFSATLYVGGPGLDGCDGSPIISAEWHGCEVIWTYD